MQIFTTRINNLMSLLSIPFVQRIPKLPNVDQIDFKKMYTTEIDDGVDQFFSKAELAEMGQYEKSRYKNMKRNYLMMLEFGNIIQIIENFYIYK